jgi:hypothetical protein
MSSRLFILYLIVGVFQIHAFSQSKKKKINNPTDKIVLLGVHIAGQQPFGTLSERYGNFATIGAGGEFKFKKGLILGMEYNWGFSENVKENTIFGHMIGPTPQLFDLEGYYSVITLQHRSQYAMGNIAYVIPFNKRNMNTGLFVQGGIGYNQHKIFIQSSEEKLPQVMGKEYKYGYDRLSSGLLTRQYVGYQRITPTGYFHFRAGIEFNQGFNQGRRVWNFQKNAPGNEERFESSIGLKFSILLPIYIKDRSQEVFFED